MLTGKTVKTIKTGRFVIPYFSQSGYSQSASLLAHNRIAASQLISGMAYTTPDTSKSLPQCQVMNSKKGKKIPPLHEGEG